MRSPSPNLLTIAGFDPCSGAGVTADLAVMSAHGCFGTACVTALTVQSTRGVRRVEAVDPQLVRETLRCVAEDLPPVGVKLGMLASAGIVEAVCEFLEALPQPVPLVLDPVIRSSSGRELLSAAGLELLRTRLLPLVSWVTPNLAELALLAGMAVEDRQSMEAAAGELLRRCPQLHLVVTGGHLDRPDDLVMVPGARPVWLAGKWVETRATHGTGCAYSTALLCRLVAGEAPEEAARSAKGFVAEAMRRATPRGSGAGPMNLLWPLEVE